MGTYRLIKRLAVGGMAEVFLGKIVGAEGFEKPVAIKRILPSYGREENTIAAAGVQAVALATQLPDGESLSLVRALRKAPATARSPSSFWPPRTTPRASPRGSRPARTTC